MDTSALKNSEHARRFASGDVILSEGEKASSEMYMVLEGRVDMYKSFKTPEERKIRDLSVGKFFGEANLFLQAESDETAVAAEDVIVYAVDRSSVFSFFQTQPQLTGLFVKNLCVELSEAKKHVPEKEAAGSAVKAEAMEDTGELFPAGHKIYTIKKADVADGLVYKKTFKCPVCENSFQADAVRASRLKNPAQDKDFRRHYTDIDTVYYEMVTCPTCWFTNFETAYGKPVIARFKENRGKMEEFRAQVPLDLSDDRTINDIFTGYFLALKSAAYFYKDPEMYIAKAWLRIKWLYNDVQDAEMELMAAKQAHTAYMKAFENTDASGEAIQQMCVLMGELSLIVKDVPNAKIFFVKARSFRGGSRLMVSQAEDGIEIIRKVESGQMQL